MKILSGLLRWYQRSHFVSTPGLQCKLLLNICCKWFSADGNWLTPILISGQGTTLKCIGYPVSVFRAKPAFIPHGEILHQRFSVDNGITFWRILNLIIPAARVFRGMWHDSSSDHIEININHTSCKMAVCIHSGGVVSVFPKRTFSLFSDIEFLGSSSCNELKTLWNGMLSCINNKQMDMILGYDIIQNTKSIPFFCFEQPIKPTPSVSLKL